MAEITLYDLNGHIRQAPVIAIAEAEDAYHNRIKEIAAYVASHEAIRIIMLAGPSGSGKTTSANLLKDAIIAHGKESIVVSLDDFYRDSSDPDYPRQADGDRDFECPESLHLAEIAETLKKIAVGEEFSLPKYDFKVGGRVSLTPHEPIRRGCVIIEGLHALNPKIADVLPHECVYKVFVSVSTNVIASDGERLISGRKIRFVRRMVRDSIYRASDAERTLGMWEDVVAAEDVYLYPYKETADVRIDTFHSFELSVMRERALKLISRELSQRNSFAAIVFTAMRAVEPLDESLVPPDSLIREFISGGIYHKIY
ncbi:MAG: hypothetical protein IKC32_04980 [Clostridia bacterium]|nr:hypothetical protein [Clostridia bacterium]